MFYLKKQGFLLLELSIMVLMVSLFSFIVLDTYNRAFKTQQRALKKLKALFYLSSYIQGLHNGVSPTTRAADKSFTLSHQIIQQTPQGRAALIQASIRWHNNEDGEESLSLNAGLLV
jgi:hypothetical protein